jgi:hypothetical protein
MTQQLIAELTTGPLAAELAPHIASGDVTAIYAALHRRDIQTPGIIETNEFVIWCAENGQRAAIEDAAQNQADPLRSVALALQDLVRGNLRQGLDFGRLETIGMAQAWRDAGKMTAEQYNSLIALSSQSISRAEQAGLAITETDIKREIWNDDGSRKL